MGSYRESHGPISRGPLLLPVGLRVRFVFGLLQFFTSFRFSPSAHGSSGDPGRVTALYDGYLKWGFTVIALTRFGLQLQLSEEERTPWSTPTPSSPSPLNRDKRTYTEFLETKTERVEPKRVGSGSSLMSTLRGPATLAQKTVHGFYADVVVGGPTVHSSKHPEPG